MILRTRGPLARLGICVAAAVVGIGAFAPAAYAAGPTDLAVSFAGGTLAADSAGKFGSLSIKNLGGNVAEDITLTFDINELDLDRVEFPLVDICEATLPGIMSCGLADNPDLGVGTETDVVIPLKTRPGMTGAAGSLKVTVSHSDTDPVTDNNTVTADLTVGGKGVDLTVLAPDVYALDTENTPVAPGGEAEVDVLVWNFGTVATGGVKIGIKLPEHVTFTEPEPDCTHEVGSTETTCEYADVVLTPVTDLDNPGSGFGLFFFPVKVDASAASPSTLTGGVAAAENLGVEAPTLARTSQRANMRTEVPAEFDDVDPSDNIDEFSVFVATPSGGGGGLPITGTNITIVGGVGLTVLVVGGVLLLMARRRRVVLAPPTDF